jgi:uncharacterized LabA/DUF88 family protein
MQRDPMTEPRLVKPTRRMMVFVDGENLVLRFQDMLRRGYIPRNDLFHDPDVAVWHPSFTYLAQFHEILRVTYYTYVVGDEPRVAQVRESLRKQTFEKHWASLLPNSLTPCVFKKDSKDRSGKGVDIKLCVDVLGHVYRRNTDAVLLMSGDGDYKPLIDEVLRNGVQVFLSAFSDGLNPRLRDIVDSLYELDGTTWKSSP